MHVQDREISELFRSNEAARLRLSFAVQTRRCPFGAVNRATMSLHDTFKLLVSQLLIECSYIPVNGICLVHGFLVHKPSSPSIYNLAMPKRKRDQIDGIQKSEQGAIPEYLIERGTQTLRRALKLAKGFERQKLARRRKNSNGVDAGIQVTRIDSEIEALKVC